MFTIQDQHQSQDFTQKQLNVIFQIKKYFDLKNRLFKNAGAKAKIRTMLY